MTKQKCNRVDVKYSIVKQNKCVSCGTCVASCPFNALKITRSSYSGNPEPKINLKKCSQCGICLAACPVDKPVVTDLSLLQDSRICTSTFDDVFKSSSSGGIVTTTLKYLFETGQINKPVVTGCRGLEAIGRIITSVDHLNHTAGSKYQPVSLVHLLKELTSADEVAFVGLPCHINGVHNLQQKQNFEFRIVLKIGLFCTIGRSFNATKAVFKKIGQPDFIQYRNQGHPGNCIASIYGRTLFVSSCTDFLQKIDYIYFLNGCQYCNDLFAVKSDISVGDAWNIGKGKEAIALSWSEFGKTVINDMNNRDFLDTKRLITENEIIESQKNGYIYKIRNYERKRKYLVNGLRPLTEYEKACEYLVQNSLLFNAPFNFILYSLFQKRIIRKRNKMLAVLTKEQSVTD